MKTGPNSYDVARAAGVARSVVSMVLNGSADKYRISRETQERVRAAIRDTGYTPKMSVRDMFLKRREVIEIGADPAGLKAAVEPALNAAGYEFQTVTLSTEPETAFAQVTAILNSGKVILVQPSLAPSNDPIPEPEPAPVVEPDVNVNPTPEPTPSPTPEPAPEPAPIVEPDVDVNPTPAPTPEPVPTPEPTPEPAPAPEPTPEPEPAPEPVPVVEPVEPEPIQPTPEPAPIVEPVVDVVPTPEPSPEPTPAPEPAPVVEPVQPDPVDSQPVI